MLVYVNGQLHDSEKEVVVIIFESDDDRLKHAGNLKNNFDVKPGRRMYSAYPKDMPHDQVNKIMDNADEAYSHIDIKNLEDNHFKNVETII